MAGAGLLPLWLLLLLSLAEPLASRSTSAGDTQRLQATPRTPTPTPALRPRPTPAPTPAPTPTPALRPRPTPAPTPTPDDPPRELLPKPLMDVPRLLSAGHDTLRFVIDIACDSLCPDIVYWDYKAEEEKEWTKKSATTESTMLHSSDSCNATLHLRNLKMSSKYLVRARPILTKKNGTGITVVDWYNLLPTKPYTETVSVLTCPAEVAAVEDLQLHSAGSGWVVLSWLPPTSSCLAELEYEVRVQAALGLGKFPFRQKGSLWSNAPWTVKKPAMPCFSWPDRHCLLIQEDSKMNRLDANKEYLIDVRVKRIEGGKVSEERKIEAHTSDFAPGPPQELCCARAQPDRMELRWRAPLRPGGVLNTAHVRVALAAHAHARPLYESSFNVSSVSRTYAHVVGARLEAGKRYDVSVRFGTRSGKEGEAARIAVWVPPSQEQSPREACEALGFEVPSSLQGQAAAGAGAEAAAGAGADTLLWGLALLLMALLAVGALFLGRRWGSRKQWSIASQDDSKSSGVGSGCSSVGDEASLCGPPAPPPLSQPPTVGARPAWGLEYAEVDLLPTGRGRSAAPRHDYEELFGRRDLGEDQAYAEVRSPAAPAPSTPPQPVYAQVDKRPAAPERPLRRQTPFS